MSTRGDKLGTTTQVKAKCGRKRRDEGRGEAAAHGEPLWLLASETEGVVRNFGKECARVRFREEILRNELPDPFLKGDLPFRSGFFTSTDEHHDQHLTDLCCMSE